MPFFSKKREFNLDVQKEFRGFLCIEQSERSPETWFVSLLKNFTTHFPPTASLKVFFAINRG
jgi:hypothetical protein